MVDPAAHRLIGDYDPALSQQVLDIAEAEGEPGIKPDGLLNDYGWEAISGVADLCHGGHLRPQITGDKPNNVTMPLDLMLLLLRLLWTSMSNLFKSRRRLEAENLFLRHQLNIALRRAPGREETTRITSGCRPTSSFA